MAKRKKARSLPFPSDKVYIYQAAFLCEADGEIIREILTQEGKAPEDPDDEESYDSDQFPKGPYPDGGGESDSPQHCDHGADCVNAIVLPSGRKVGQWLENPLTEDGIKYVCDAVAKGGEVAALWADFYRDDLKEIDCIAEREIQDRGRGYYLMAKSVARHGPPMFGVGGPWRDLLGAIDEAESGDYEDREPLSVVFAESLADAEEGRGLVEWSEGERRYPVDPGQERLPGIAERRRRR